MTDRAIDAMTAVDYDPANPEHVRRYHYDAEYHAAVYATAMLLANLTVPETTTRGQAVTIIAENLPVSPSVDPLEKP